MGQRPSDSSPMCFGTTDSSYSMTRLKEEAEEADIYLSDRCAPDCATVAAFVWDWQLRPNLMDRLTVKAKADNPKSVQCGKKRLFECEINHR